MYCVWRDMFSAKRWEVWFCEFLLNVFFERDVRGTRWLLSLVFGGMCTLGRGRAPIVVPFLGLGQSELFSRVARWSEWEEFGRSFAADGWERAGRVLISRSDFIQKRTFMFNILFLSRS